MTLVRGKETFKIKELIRTGRSCTAVIKNAKGKEERLSITNMWEQKISILNPDKKIPVKKVEEKKVVIKPVKAEKVKPEPAKAKVVPAVEPLRKEEFKRGKGICTIYLRKDGTVISNSWKRTF